MFMQLEVKKMRSFTTIAIAVFASIAATLAGATPALASAGDDAHLVKLIDTVGSGSVGEEAIHCPSGERAISGGVLGVNDKNSTLRSSGPLDETGVTVNTVDGDIPRYWYSAVSNGT